MDRLQRFLLGLIVSGPPCPIPAWLPLESGKCLVWFKSKSKSLFLENIIHFFVFKLLEKLTRHYIWSTRVLSAFSSKCGLCLCTLPMELLWWWRVEECQVWAEALQSLKFCITYGDIWGFCIWWSFRKPINIVLSMPWHQLRFIVCLPCARRFEGRKVVW